MIALAGFLGIIGMLYLIGRLTFPHKVRQRFMFLRIFSQFGVLLTSNAVIMSFILTGVSILVLSPTHHPRDGGCPVLDTPADIS